jgi:hypothetical protein
MAEVHGIHSQFLMDPTGGGTPVEVATVTGYTWGGTRARVAVTPLGASNIRYVQGLPDYSGTFTANWDSEDLTLLEAALAGDAVTLRLVPDDGVATTYIGGLAYIDATLATSSTAAATMGGSYAAADDWTLTQAP